MPRSLLAATLIAAALAWVGGPSRAARASAADEPLPHRVGQQAHSLATIPRASVLYYKEQCLQCHGVTGEGDGEGSKELDPKPRSFRDPEWQRSVTDQKIREATVKGGPAVGLSEAMPAYPDLEGQPEKVDGLVALIRAFGTVAK